MVKVVLDTSVLAAAFLKRGGVNHQVLERASLRYRLYLSEAIVEETQRVLLTYGRIRRRYPYSDQDVRDFIEALREVSEEVFTCCPEVRVVEEDPKDDIVLACGVKAKADYIVSKDQHLVSLREYRGIKLVSTDEFLKVVLKQDDA